MNGKIFHNKQILPFLGCATLVLNPHFDALLSDLFLVDLLSSLASFFHSIDYGLLVPVYWLISLPLLGCSAAGGDLLTFSVLPYLEDCKMQLILEGLDGHFLT